jgi:23S rRNA (adenine2503-C2)-methyltransferase
MSVAERRKESILGLPLDDLKKKFQENGLSDLDAKRVFPWIHARPLALSFDDMSDVPKRVRAVLSQLFLLALPKCNNIRLSKDGTQKALLEFDDSCTETVFIPDENRNTVCVSSQIGCALGCKFCCTGTQGFSRNLSSSEIISQIFFWKSMEKAITNVVFMGMGEPILNAQSLFYTLELLLSEKAHNFSRNKITVSTSGIADNSVLDLAKFGVKLAISLHAADDEKRSMLMPINKKYNLKSILAIAREYLKASNTDNVTFEYILLSGVNDSDEDAMNLVSLLRSFGAHCRVNLIMFNSWDGTSFAGSSKEKAHYFLRLLLSKGIRAIIRKSRGCDIMAACGQLKTLVDSQYSL